MLAQSVTEVCEAFYTPWRTLPTGEIAGVHDYLFTAAIVVGIDRFGFRTRYCYENRPEAEAALQAWDGDGDPPGNWIKQKPEERRNPNYDIFGSAA